MFNKLYIYMKLKISVPIERQFNKLMGSSLHYKQLEEKLKAKAQEEAKANDIVLMTFGLPFTDNSRKQAEATTGFVRFIPNENNYVDDSYVEGSELPKHWYFEVLKDPSKIVNDFVWMKENNGEKCILHEPFPEHFEDEKTTARRKDSSNPRDIDYFWD